jgi:TonB family protein
MRGRRITMKARLTFLALGTALALPVAVPAAERPAVEVPFLHYVEPIYPLALTFESIHEGYAEIGFVVSPEGNLVESFVTEYSHPAFSDEVERSVKQCKFKPLAADQPQVARRYFLRFNFRREGAVVVISQLDAVMGRIWAAIGSDAVSVCKLRELDQIPDLLTIVVPHYPAEMVTKRTAGNALVTFYIDETGTVRAAGVIEASRPEFGTAAVEAVRQWKFVPPTRKQCPVRVFAAQEFIFNPELPTAEGRAR